MSKPNEFWQDALAVEKFLTEQAVGVDRAVQAAGCPPLNVVILLAGEGRVRMGMLCNGDREAVELARTVVHTAETLIASATNPGEAA